MPTVNFSISAQSENPTKVVVKTGEGFEIIVDEPENMGGTNDGASPVDYVIAALSGCLNVVGHLVAKEMGIELRGLSIDISGELDPAKFMGKSDEVRAGYQAINVEIDADCDADQAVLDEWIEAVESRCPVSDNLANKTPVNISVK